MFAQAGSRTTPVAVSVTAGSADERQTKIPQAIVNNIDPVHTPASGVLKRAESICSRPEGLRQELETKYRQNLTIMGRQGKWHTSGTTAVFKLEKPIQTTRAIWRF